MKHSKKIISLFIIITLTTISQTPFGKHFIQNINHSQTSSEDNYYEILSNNVDKKENVKLGKITYTGFDKLGRTKKAYGLLTYKNIQYGYRERADISMYRPSGWTRNKQVTLTFSDGTKYHGFFYNRSHLIGHALGGEDKKYNLITGTRCQNVGKNDNQGGMQYGERKIYNYLKNHRNNNVYYEVDPYYQNNEKVARYVLVKMQSNDKSINETVKVFNTAPGYTIDYQTGNYYKN